MSSELEIRTATAEDEQQVLELLSAAMGQPNDDRVRRLLRWKHELNPFGTSPAWVAVVDGQVAGYRAFLRWQFHRGAEVLDAVRAVDTATDPAHQGKGIFRALTMHALEELRAGGVQFVFNTPNDNSRPGYLKMGWELVGRLQPWMRPRRFTDVPTIARGRAAAGLFGEPSVAGAPATECFADDHATAELLESTSSADRSIRTARTPDYLRWRYDAELLGYRVVALSSDVREGAACFRLRRRGAALEATIGDLLAPENDSALRRRLLRSVARETGANYVLCLDGSWPDRLLPMPNQGPTLVWRALNSHRQPQLDEWALTMGDIELF